MLDRVRSIIGPDGVRTGAEVGRWAVHGVAPRAVAAPATDEEAAALLALASAEGWAIELAGAGGWLDAGRRRTRLDLVVSTERIAARVEHEPADLVATVDAGVPLRALQERLAPRRQWLPLDPPAHAGATVGAVASLAAAGPLREAHGTPRDHVLGLRLVTGDGRILDLGGRVVKNVAGYDLAKLVVGSRGTLGLITRLHVRLRPVPERDATLVVRAERAAPLVELVARIREERIEAAALELVSAAALAPVIDGTITTPTATAMDVAPEAYGAHGQPWCLLVRFQGSAEAVADAGDRVARLARSLGLGAGAPVADAERLWAGINELEAGAEFSVRLADSPDRLGATLAAAVELAAALDAAMDGRVADPAGRSRAEPADSSDSGARRWALLAHAGAGIVRLCGPGPVPDADDAAAPAARADVAADECAAALHNAREALAGGGGTLTIARAPVALLDRVEPFGDPGPALRLMRAIKAHFDPAGVLAPGRFVV